MSQITRLDQTHSEAINELVSKSFGYISTSTKPHSFFDDFPVWNSNDVIRLGILDAGKLVSHVGLRIVEMFTHNSREKFALIGAVATHTQFRGKGLSTSLLKEAIRISENENCKWSVLWGSEHEFYGKLGFQLSGAQGRALIGDLSVLTQDLRTSEIKMGFDARIFKTLCEEKIGIQFKPIDLAWISKQKTVKWFYLENPFAFIAFERGMDLPHTVHEVGGDLKGIQKLLFHVHSLDQDAQIIAKPDTLSSLGFLGQEMIEEFLCLARPKIKGDSWNPNYWISGLSAC